MKTGTKYILICSIAFVAVSLLVGRAAWRAHLDLVTLDVRNAEVRDVVKKIERQTWESIFVGKDVEGEVTLNVRNAPLDAVLEMIGGQVSARPRHVFPVYKSKQALSKLHSLVQLPSSNLAHLTTWTNFHVGRGGGPRGGGFFGGGFGPDDQATNNLVSLDVINKETFSVARTLGFATRMQIVPEDSLPSHVSLTLNNATPEESLEKFAKAVKGKTDEFYVLHRNRMEAPRPPSEGDEERRKEMMAARMQSMSEEEKARIEEMRNMTPEERQAQMQARMQDPAVQARMAERMLNGIRTSTPEQIVHQKRERMMRRQQMQQAGSNRGR